MGIIYLQGAYLAKLNNEAFHSLQLDYIVIIYI